MVFQVKKILQTIKLGTYTPEIAVLLCNTVLINGMMTNAEIWYNLSNTQVKEVEKDDLLLFQKMFNIPTSVPQVALYLEFGGMPPVAVIFKVRRLTYLHSILRSSRSGILYSGTFLVKVI